ncbi:DDB1- and CUL4-associated factor 12 [Boothiomyces macroporosus]|uniref:DDB1- and CUL4-associated factor 12 n=1 Tax=Boothiomyces macroporosus TaxID=261099 RepID=A0AAD5Y8I1_9FUNG|nr:DDB1- and CUL4-associated factor 12 [Boothiomyces macroporosus]
MLSRQDDTQEIIEDTPTRYNNTFIQIEHRELGIKVPGNSKTRPCPSASEANPTESSNTIKRIINWMYQYPVRNRPSQPPSTSHISRISSESTFPSLELQRNMCNNSLESMASRKLAGSLKQEEFDFAGADKIFSSAWLDDEHVILGTKCQRLIVLNVKTKKQIQIPGCNTINYPPSGETSLYKLMQCSGIHSIAINPSKTMLAAGAGKPSESIHIYSLPSFEIIAILDGHVDMVFSISWLDDFNLVSGSRDKSLKVWKIHEPFATYNSFNLPERKIYQPANSLIRHDQKVRDLAFDRSSHNIFTLSADGTVKIWDSKECTVTNSVPLYYTNETVCLGLDTSNHLIGVGSQSHVSLIDPRIGKIVHIVDSLDDGWGVRSLCTMNSLLTIGGGLGRISFYDLRVQRYLEWQGPSTSPSKSLFQQSGSGWLDKDVIFQRHFQGIPVYNAVYSMAYDSSGSRLFTCGGPLQLNLRGSYAGLWE